MKKTRSKKSRDTVLLNDKELRDSSCSNDGFYVFRKYRTTSLNFKQNCAHAPEIDPDAERGKTSFPGNKRRVGRGGMGRGVRPRTCWTNMVLNTGEGRKAAPQMFP